ncbi:MAG TPA: carboxylating nicotinate-nucleotide diphosphorylase [Nitrospiria bacterium]|nr:carboxylating nicotinate-nucleotide diphosphorylase [Nitrospiria bacterium]
MIATPAVLREFVERALAEDIGRGDATTQALFSDPAPAIGRVSAKNQCVVAGGTVAALVFQTLDRHAAIEYHIEDGQTVLSGDPVLTVRADGRMILTGERVALNILQRLCGIATVTRSYVDAVRGYATKIVDTRKSPAGWRVLDKYAVRCGGGVNHRFGLDDGILIKDTHLALAGGIETAVRRARVGGRHGLKVEVEVQTLDEVRMALDAGADILLLDNMDLTAIREALALIKGRALVEVSGGVTLAAVRDIAALGVDIVSVGALTHSAPAADLHMDVWPA